jgi:hypothetical protein
MFGRGRAGRRTGRGRPHCERWKGLGQCARASGARGCRALHAREAVGSLSAVHDPPLVAVPPETPVSVYPITPKEHGTDFLMDTATCGCARASARDHAGAHTIVKAIRDYFDTAASPWSTRRSSRPTPVRARAPCSRPTTTATRPTSRSRASSTWRPPRWPVRQGVLLRPDLPRREVEDAPPPRRVLDGRARGGLHGPRRRHGPRRGLPRASSCSACSRTASEELKILERDTTRSSRCRSPSPHPYERGHRLILDLGPSADAGGRGRRQPERRRLHGATTSAPRTRR